MLRAARALLSFVLLLSFLVTRAHSPASSSSPHSPHGPTSHAPPAHARARRTGDRRPGRVLVGTLDGRVHAFDAWSGEFSWTFVSGGTLVTSSAFAPATGGTGGGGGGGGGGGAGAGAGAGVASSTEAKGRGRAGGGVASSSSPGAVALRVEKEGSMVVPGLDGSILMRQPHTGLLEKLPINARDVVDTTIFVKGGDDVDKARTWVNDDAGRRRGRRGGRLFVGEKTRRMYALDPATGRVREGSPGDDPPPPGQPTASSDGPGRRGGWAGSGTGTGGGGGGGGGSSSIGRGRRPLRVDSLDDIITLGDPGDTFEGTIERGGSGTGDDDTDIAGLEVSSDELVEVLPIVDEPMNGGMNDPFDAFGAFGGSCEDGDGLPGGGGGDGTGGPMPPMPALIIGRTEFRVRSLDSTTGAELWNMSVGEFDVFMEPLVSFRVWGA